MYACRNWRALLLVLLWTVEYNAWVGTLCLRGTLRAMTISEEGCALDNSFFYELPGIGHGAMCSNECGLELSIQFLADPNLLA